MNKVVAILGLLFVVAGFIGIFQQVSIVDIKASDEVDSRLALTNEVTEKTSEVQESEHSKPWLSLDSLSDMQMNFQLQTDSQDNLIVDARIKDLFDTYLSTLGETELEEIVAKIKQHLAATLPEPALQQGYQLLSQYMDYQQALMDLQQYLNDNQQGLSELEKLEIKNAKITKLRHDYFSEQTYQAFFALSEQYDHYMLEQLRIRQNTELSPQEKQLALQAHELNLPDDVRRSSEQATLYGNVFEQVEHLRESGASDIQIFQARAHALGQPAAQALSQLDHEQALWQKRVDRFVEKKTAIEQSSLSEGDQKAAIARILSDEFTQIEALRVQAIASSY